MDLKEKLLAFAIAIIFAFFVAYGYNTFDPEPKYDEYCTNISYNVAIDDCPEWQSPEKGLRPVPLDESCWCNQDCSSGDCIKGDCFERNPEHIACEEQWNTDQEAHNKLIFIASLVIGLLALVLGGVLIANEPISIGLMGGGIFTMIYGTLRYWGELEDWGRFLIMGIVLGILIWVGYKKFSPPIKRK